MKDLRISRHRMFLDMAKAAAARGTCYRLQVGCIIVNGNHQPIAMGYNGPPSGEPHCSGLDCRPPGVLGCTRSLHAEANALARISKMPYGVDLRMYITDSPCIHCAEKIIGEPRITAVYFEREYRDPTGPNFLATRGIEVFKVTLAGHLINWRTGQLIDD
jgi:dCMP deaminase